MPILKFSDKDKGDQIGKALSKLPPEMSTGEVSALIMTITDAYMSENKSAAISLLLTSGIVYARASGIPDEKIAIFLRSTADHLDDEPYSPKVH
jgi:hypothetical protein